MNKADNRLNLEIHFRILKYLSMSKSPMPRQLLIDKVSRADDRFSFARIRRALDDLIQKKRDKGGKEYQHIKKLLVIGKGQDVRESSYELTETGAKLLDLLERARKIYLEALRDNAYKRKIETESQLLAMDFSF